MRLILEEYGGLIIAMLGGIAILGIIFDLLNPGGTLHEAIVRFAESAC